MFFKKIISMMTMSSLLLLFGGFQVIAATTTGESTAKIEFTIPDDVPEVVDPEEPTTPYEPDPDDQTTPQDPPTGQAGPLTLDYVSSIDFGAHPIPGSTAAFKSTILKPFIQVTDRRGTGAGWTVTAQVSAFEGTNSTPSLQGAKITFSNGDAISPNNGTAPTVAGLIELVAGGDASEVVTAAPNTGMTTWITRWLANDLADVNDKVTLEVPGGDVTIGNHTATITWTLTDAP